MHYFHCFCFVSLTLQRVSDQIVCLLYLIWESVEGPGPRLKPVSGNYIIFILLLITLRCLGDRKPSSW